MARTRWQTVPLATALSGLDAGGPRARVTLGVGPFTLYNHELLPPSIGLRVHRFLQGLADRRVRVIRSSGSQYTVLTRKRDKARFPPAKLA